MSIWKQMADEIFERKAGRIRATPGGFVFDAPDWLLEKTRKLNPNLVVNGRATIRKKDQDGREMVQVSQRTVVCPLKEGRDGKYPRGKNGWYYPERLCKKCPHRLLSGKEYKWPRCALNAVDNPKKAAAAEFVSCFTRAADKANKLLG